MFRGKDEEEKKVEQGDEKRHGDLISESLRALSHRKHLINSLKARGGG